MSAWLISFSISFNNIIYSLHTIIDTLRKSAWTIILTSLEENNWANYHSSYLKYEDFCIKYLIRINSPSIDNILCFSKYLLDCKLMPSSVKNVISGVKTVFAWLDWDTKVFSSHMMRANFRSLDKLNGLVCSTQSVVSADDLSTLVSKFGDDPALCQLKFALILMYIGFLRVSNIVPKRICDFHDVRSTKISDIFTVSNGMVVQIRWTKWTTIHPPSEAVR